MTADVISTPADTSSVFAVSAQALVTGGASPTGILKLQASNDGINYTDVPSATVSISADGSYLIPVVNVAYEFIRAVYSFTSGTGTLTATIKTVGY
jgi:hypothetical protein